jgi:hypothetical protein
MCNVFNHEELEALDLLPTYKEKNRKRMGRPCPNISTRLSLRYCLTVCTADVVGRGER